ncbi:MAG: GNAT family N-acetyltransferase [Oliverpabstia sp.]|nr:GNAT family N-acetyltransferase [Eubacterium sp.]
MKIRKLEKADYAIVDVCMKELHTLHVAGRPDLYIPLEHIYTEQEFFSIVEDKRHIAIAAVDENETIMGFCIADLRDKSGMVENVKTIYVDEIFVRKEQRRKGIAKELFCSLEAIAKSYGVVRIDLMVWEFNKEALKLYEKMGMKPQRYILEKNIDNV